MGGGVEKQKEIINFGLSCSRGCELVDNSSSDGFLYEIWFFSRGKTAVDKKRIFVNNPTAIRIKPS